ncbi:MAG: hypothetical protein ACXVAY_20185 [Mucilaginibacter sp.]
MDKTAELIFTIIGGALTLLTVYGAFKADRKLFLSGVCFFSILPIIGESMGYSADKGAVHIMVIMIYVVQFILAFPSNIQYGPENTAAGKLVGKMGLALLVCSVAGAVFILCLHAPVPRRFGAMHAVMALAIFYIIIRRATGKGWAK